MRGVKRERAGAFPHAPRRAPQTARASHMVSARVMLDAGVLRRLLLLALAANRAAGVP